MKIWVNGSFDIMHIGHIKLLEYAHTFGEVRVGLDTDYRIRLAKGDRRPYNSLQDRINFISSIKYVHSVVTFNSDEELEYEIKKWGTDIMVIGSDYENKNIVGGHIPERIIFFNRLPDKSTTNILSYEKDISNR
jgi:D-beta-D-heptose 7-phosphate kinase/D-beta-D-heptose 1-phosphate adenosyltransferase